MTRGWMVTCSDCECRYFQDFENPDECPRCHNEKKEDNCAECGEVSVLNDNDLCDECQKAIDDESEGGE